MLLCSIIRQLDVQLSFPVSWYSLAPKWLYQKHYISYWLTTFTLQFSNGWMSLLLLLIIQETYVELCTWKRGFKNILLYLKNKPTNKNPTRTVPLILRKCENKNLASSSALLLICVNVSLQCSLQNKLLHSKHFPLLPHFNFKLISACIIRCYHHWDLNLQRICDTNFSSF